jgi:hypothetical protein
MYDALFWIYEVNAALLIMHEIDSAYWKEWELFHLPGGIGGFLALHLPLIMVIFYGFSRVIAQTTGGLVFSLILSLAGMAAFTIHMVFLKKGNKRFRTAASISLLAATLAVSIIQAAVTVYLLAV